MRAGGFDEEVLETAVARKPVLAALADGPRHRQELQEELDLSKTTCHRIIRTFDEQGLLRRTDDGYALSTLGELIAEQTAAFDRNVRASYQLEPLVAAFEAADIDVAFPVELFADARLTRPEPDDPMVAVNRACELFFGTDSESVRTIDRTQFVPPVFLEDVFESGIEQALKGEFIYPKSVALRCIREFPDYHRRIPDVDASLRYRIYEDIPFGMSIYDDYVDVRAYDEETGAPVLLADTDDPDALSWAEDVYARYRARSEPPAAFAEFPDWLPDPDFEI